MKTTKLPIKFADLPKDYASLCGVYLPRPIHNEAEFELAFELGSAMAGHKLTPDQEDYMEMLAGMIEDYEKKSLTSVPKVGGVRLLKFLLEENGMNASDLARLLGVDRTLGSSILRGKRRLTADHIRTLARRFAISADALLEP